MASSISSGFPGVRTKIVDSSQYIEALSSNLIGFICICSEKGPDNTPVMATSASDFIRRYGQPSMNKFGPGAYVALQYLKTLSNLYVMRVLPDDATYAYKALKLTSTDTVTKYQEVEEVDAEGNTVKVYKEIVPVTISENAYAVTEEDLSKDLNEVLSNLPEGTTDVIVPEGAFGYSLTMDDGTAFKGARASVKPTSDEARTGGETVIEAPVEAVGDITISGVTFKGNALSSEFADTGVIVVSNSIFSELSAAGTSFSVVEYNPSDPETSFDASETEDMVIKEVIDREYSFLDTELKYFNDAPSIDTPLNEGEADIIFYPYGRGEYYNNIGFKLTKARKSYEGAFVLDIYTKSDTSVYANLVESFIVSFDQDATDSSGASIFIKDVLDRYSEYLRCKVSENIGQYEESTDEELKVINVSYDNLAMTQIDYLSGGSDGEMYTKSGALDWSKMTSPMVMAYSGLIINPETGEDNGFMTDTEDWDVSVIYDCGYPTPVKDAIIELCNTRNTCFGILDNGIYTEQGNKNAKAAVDERLSDHNWSNYRVALYEPYTKIYDAYTGRNVWMTPIYHVCDLMVRTARDYDIFWAFAGMNRGAVTTSIQQYRYLLQGGYRDQFKDEELNPIVRFTNGGDCLF